MFNFLKSRRRQDAPRCVLFGADTSGKTTLLYMWHLGEVVTTIPTIGFNVETISHSGRTLQVLDFGGCDNLAPLGRHYLDSTTGILFLHNLNSDSDRIKDSIALLKMHVEQLEYTNGKYIWVMLTKQDLVPAEDLDTRRADVYEMIKNELRECEPRVQWKVFDERGLNALNNSKTWPLFDEIAEVLNKQRTISEPVSVRKNVSEAELVERIKRESDNNGAAEDFWRAFLTAELPQWNHYSHLRVGFIILLKSAAMLEDFWTVIDLFLAHIGRLRASRPDRFRNTAHRTMTMFWLYILRNAILEFKIQMSRLPEADEFQDVLLRQPCLADTGLWEDFYSRGVMLTPEAKQKWCLPDKKPLPAIIQTDSRPELSVRNSASDDKKGSKVLITTETEAKHQERLISFALLVVQQYLATGERRGKVIASALLTLQKSTTQMRAANPLASLAPYSETQAYFWIQIVHATLLPFHQQAAKLGDGYDTLKSAHENLSTSPVIALTFAQFNHIFQLEYSMWKRYYSPMLWSSVKARMEFTNPDLRPLPNVIPKEAPSIIATRFIEMIGAANMSVISTSANSAVGDEANPFNDAHSPAELALRIEDIVATTENFQNGALKQGKHQTLESQTAHCLWLFHLYSAYSQSVIPIDNSLDVPRFVSSLIGHRDATDDKLDIPTTKVLFYARMVLATQGKTAGNVPTDKNLHSMDLSTSNKTVLKAGFRAFLESRSYLVWNELPFTYYRPETWKSLDARKMFVEPDLAPLPGT